MRSEIDDPLLNEIVKKLIVEFHPEKAYLFCSRARGGAHTDSDYDVLLVIQSSDRGRLDRIAQARAA